MAKRRTEDVEPEFVSTRTIAKKVDRSTETIRREIKAGRLKAKRFGTDYLVEVSEYNAWKNRYFKDEAS